MSMPYFVLTQMGNLYFFEKMSEKLKKDIPYFVEVWYTTSVYLCETPAAAQNAALPA